MARYAIIRNALVENVCEWDGDTANWQPPSGTAAILAPVYVGIGYTFNGSVWTPPAAPAPVEPIDFVRFSPRDLLQAFVDQGALTAARRDAILAALKR